jgi:hypothetical protein
MGLTDYTISDKKYWQAGRDYENERIVKLLEGRIETIKAQGDWGFITAMGQPVEPQDAIAITEAIIYAIKEGQK